MVDFSNSSHATFAPVGVSCLASQLCLALDEVTDIFFPSAALIVSSSTTKAILQRGIFLCTLRLSYLCPDIKYTVSLVIVSNQLGVMSRQE